ncbi:Membrane protein, putative [Shewanella piezotolerans WP3]|uniref:Membrane protein, putative n=2 Tax=Shewanella TaxID=22 RepID=B8CT77_SHEPW|nr:Membrane protein, putative [Shewanella piezotolerans WP3]
MSMSVALQLKPLLTGTTLNLLTQWLSPYGLRRSLVALTLLLVTALSWYYMLFAMSMNMDPVQQWQLHDIAMLFVMWAIMMAGMMLPSAAPVILLVEKLNQQRKQRHSSYAPSLYFMLGYLIAWSFYSAIITLVQYGLHHLSLLNSMMISANDTFTAALLFIAGIYQFTPLKQACLSQCRSPIGFISSQWREGIDGAIWMGFKHGQYCLGCCWFLMALLFATGVMNLKWILLLTLLVMLEKLLPFGKISSRVIGVILISSAFYYLI